MNIKALLTDMTAKKATDLYLSVGNQPIYRINGTLYPMSGTSVLTLQAIEALLMPFLTAAQENSAWKPVSSQQFNIELRDPIVEGELFTDGGCLAAAFHRVI